MVKNMKVRTKLGILLLLVFASVMAVAAFNMQKLKDSCDKSTEIVLDTLNEGYDEEIQFQVDNAISMIEAVYAKQQAGEYTEAEAKKLAADLVRELRYGESGYFWIDTYEGDNVVLLGNETEGTNRMSTEDVNGYKMVQDIIANGQKEGGGFTEYYFPKEGSEEAYPKRAYSKAFEPYQWVIGTGNYIDELEVAAQEKTKLQLDEFQRIRKAVIIILIIVIAIVTLVTGFISTEIFVSLKHAMEYLERMAQGDYAHEMSAKYTKRKDDFGDLARGMEKMQISTRDLIAKVKAEAENITNMVDEVHNNSFKLNGEIESVTATTEQLAAGMEETAATTEEVNSSSAEVGEAIQSISKRSQEGAEKAAEISIRAEETKEKVAFAKEKASGIKRKIQTDLELALEQAKVVEEIYALSEAIMQITSQTNLLALNASIEAARAGEAGKGFAVVAGEIGHLAEQSKDTVMKIQQVTENVTEAVKNLSENSKKLIDFVSNDVSADYAEFLEVGKQYSEDASFVGGLVSEFSATAQELDATMQSIMSSIGEISRASAEGANGTTHIAQSATDMMQASENVLEEVKKAHDSANVLHEEISKFIVS